MPHRSFLLSKSRFERVLHMYKMIKPNPIFEIIIARQSRSNLLPATIEIIKSSIKILRINRYMQAECEIIFLLSASNRHAIAINHQCGSFFLCLEENLLTMRKNHHSDIYICCQYKEASSRRPFLIQDSILIKIDFYY